jgi:cytochrome c-type biogenesis protein CcmH
MKRSLTACLLVAAALVVLEPLTARGAEPDGKTHQIEARFVAPCCWRENLAVHNSPIAAELRTEIAARVAAGQTEPQIVDYYVARFGERILREPRGVRFQILTMTPIAILGLGLLFVSWILLRVHHNNQDNANAVAQPALPDDEFEYL